MKVVLFVLVICSQFASANFGAEINNLRAAIAEGDEKKIYEARSTLIEGLPNSAERRLIQKEFFECFKNEAVAARCLGSLRQFGMFDPAFLPRILELTQSHDASLRAEAYTTLWTRHHIFYPSKDLLLTALRHEDSYVAGSAILYITPEHLRDPSIRAAFDHAVGNLRDLDRETVIRNINDSWKLNLPKVSPTIAISVIGDSISEATLSATSLVGPFPRNVNMEGGIGYFGMFRYERDDWYLNSWFKSGNNYSHYAKMKNYMAARGMDPRGLVLFDNSVNGGDLEVLESYAANIVQMSWDYPPTAHYVAIELGGNDLCAGHTSQLFIGAMSKALRNLERVEAKGKVKVLLVGPPPVHELASPAIWNKRTIGGWTCGKLHTEDLQVCPALYKSPQQVKRLWEEYRVGMRDLAQQYQGNDVLDVVYTDVLSQMKLEPKYLAWDCFHPSRLGQQALSEALWRAQPWFK